MEQKEAMTVGTGAVTGAGTGAAAGSIAGPVGTALGAFGGAIVGAVASKKLNDKQIAETKKNNYLNMLRDDTAVARQYKQYLQSGLNPTANAAVNAPDSSALQSPSLQNFGSQIGSQVGSAISSAGNMFAQLHNSELQRQFMDNQARLQGALQMVQIGYKNTLDRYNLNNQFVQETSLAIRDIETKVVTEGTMSQQQLSEKKTQLNEYTKNVHDAYNSMSELFAKTGTSLTDFSKQIERDDSTISADFSVNPVKFILTGIDFSGKETTSKGFEKAKQYVVNSDMSAADKKEFNKALDSFIRSCKSLESVRTSLNQASSSSSHTIQQTGFGSYCEMVSRIEELKQENEGLFHKLSPDYMFEYYKTIFNQNY